MTASSINEPYQSFLMSVPPFSDTMSQDALYELLTLLDHPEEKLQVIHIAGTNGKGSSVAALNQLLQASGYLVATFTSPYIHDIRECIHYNSSMITIDFMNHVTNLVTDAYLHMKSMGRPLPTHYECITATAYLAMSLWQVDYCIVEVLMGGKDDATNVFTSIAAALITSISYDHTQYLGNTLESIASHKAGIIKADCPVFLNSNPQAVCDVCTKKAAALHAPLYTSTNYLADDTGWTDTDLQSFRESYTLIGAHQSNNLAGILSVYHYLLHKDGHPIQDSIIRKTLANIQLPCRMEILHDTNDHAYLLDGGHNDAGLSALYHLLDTDYQDTPIHLIFSTLADKENTDAMNRLINRADRVYFCPVNNERSATPNELYERTTTDNRDKCHTYPSLEDAFEAEKNTHQQPSSALTVVCGSFYLAYPIRSLIV